ncbi:exonuclease [Pseudomonas phage PspYZU05]|uniref:Exonuclease A n=1 Tax=Pseudomonas phage PspYZU05 TaxID=1983556 RepID=A0A2U7NMX8_9CAUD|nr:exonuclease [Pseudomonas phage PspYZU05]ASD51977.1 exonuclease A [Pseudomonas phage PspYZU05]
MSLKGKTQVKDFIIDYETVDNIPSAKAVDLSVIVFNSDLSVLETFEELVNSGKKIKFDLKSQVTRTKSNSTVKWWKTQPPEVREALKPTPNDVTIEQALEELSAFLKDNGVDRKVTHGFCRGMSFDFPILVSMLHDVELAKGTLQEDIDTSVIEPCWFWNQRDVRTAIESMLLTRDLTMTPLPKGTLDGFIAHNSIHDCAKDILMLKYAYRYAVGLDEMPSPENTDPRSLRK